MNWEELTGDEFPNAAKKAQGVCLVPLSCIERHAHHLPMNCDTLIARETCRRTALMEPAVIFPDVIFTQILEARHCPGTIAIDLDLSVKLLDNICREIARNGFDKIILANGHGGNWHMLHFFNQMQLASPRDYVVYTAQPSFLESDKADIAAQFVTGCIDHAGEAETSLVMAVRPDLVDRSKLVDDKEGLSLGRSSALRSAGLETGILWYADHPTHYKGQAIYATAEKGNRLFDAHARWFAEAIRAAKRDTTARKLQDEFFARALRP